ncbi:MAG: hypothetical protein VKN33_03730 [Candidatus Sericytochromatia bacterium]|nr:hypothetical protein [Candidatus Sericytochromatia bacterium]
MEFSERFDERGARPSVANEAAQAIPRVFGATRRGARAPRWACAATRRGARVPRWACEATRRGARVSSRALRTERRQRLEACLYEAGPMGRGASAENGRPFRAVPFVVP